MDRLHLSHILELTKTLKEFSESFKQMANQTAKLTKWLIFWTAVMAFAIIGQIITIILIRT